MSDQTSAPGLDRRELLRAGASALAGASAFAGCVGPSSASPAGALSTEAHRLKVETRASGLDGPWAIAFLPGGERMLVTEKKAGRLRVVTAAGELGPPIEGLPPFPVVGQGGLMDVILHPAFAEKRWIYLSYAHRVPEGAITALLRFRLSADERRAEAVETLFVGTGASGAGQHFGGRLAFLPDGLLLLTIGDRGQRDTVQSLSNHRGKVLRLTEDGRPTPGNPFAGVEGALPEIYSYGHRNPQGLALDGSTGAIWIHEHGPQGGDEVNRVLPGSNYGWPKVTYGREYGSGARIGPSTGEGVEPPRHYYVPSIAPCGLCFYEGGMFPKWRGNLLLGALAGRHLNRVVLDDAGRFVKEERIGADWGRRIREVRAAPDGAVWLATDEGELLRLSAA